MINMDYSDDVYKPSDDTYLVLDNAECGKSVLEMGSGSGLIAITLAKQGHNVTAADISPEAINLTKSDKYCLLDSSTHGLLQEIYRLLQSHPFLPPTGGSHLQQAGMAD